MAVPPLHVFGTVPNGQTIPLNWLDENFTYIENQVSSLSGGVLTISGGATGLLPSVPTAGNVVLSGVLNIANGGTGATTLTGLQTAVFPSQSGAAGQFLKTDGTNVSWAPAGAGATLTVGGSSVTGGTSGYILYNNSGTLGNLATVGSGNVVLATAPTITRPLNVAPREKQNSGVIAAGVLTIDCNAGSVLSVTLNANVTSVVFTNVPAISESYSIILSFTADGTARTIAWPASVRWPNSTAPTPTSTSGKVDTYVLYTYDGGTTWFGFISGQNA